MIFNAINWTTLAETLHRGNSNPPDWCRRSFYGAKSFLLSAFGTPDGRDIQRIDSPCWSCGGSGDHHDMGDCWKCSGTGVHHSRLIWLDRYKFGGFSFHCPVNGVEFGPDAKPTIKGRIEHEPYADAYRHAVDIAWLFNRDALKAEVEGFCPWLSQSPLTLDGPGAVAVNQWVKDKKLESDRAWKSYIEEKVDSCPF